MNKFLLILFITILSSTIVPFVNAQEKGASLLIHPQTGAYVEGSSFEVSVFLNTADNYVDIVEVDLKFDPDILQVISPTKEFSIVGNWTSPPTFSNTEGVVSLRGRFKDRGVNVSEGLISIVVFRAKSAGEATIKFLDSSKVISTGEKAANILNSVNMATFSIFPSLPKGPSIFSNTHPDQNKRYKNNSPVFFWNKTAKAEGFSYSFDNNPYGEPDNIIDTTSDSQFFEGVESGIWHFHLKAKEERFWGGVSHFKVNIDNVPPLSFKPRPENFGATFDNYLLIHFSTVDLLSGIDHFEVRLEDRSNPKNILYSGFIETDSPYRLNIENRGAFKVTVRAFDKAGNYQEGEIMVRVFNPGLATITGGVIIKGIFFPWWLTILFLIIILLAVGGIIIFKNQRKKNIQKRLEKDIKEVEENLDDIKKLEEEIEKKPSVGQGLRRAWERLENKIKNTGQNSKNKL